MYKYICDESARPRAGIVVIQTREKREKDPPTDGVYINIVHAGMK